MAFPYTVALKYGKEKVTTTGKKHPLGTRGVLPDGRVYRYAVNGGAAVESSELLQAAVEPNSSGLTNALDVVGGATTGVTTLSVVTAVVTPTALAANYFAGGYLTVDTSPGQGMYRIKSHAAFTSAAAGNQITFEEDDVIREALTSGTSKVGLRRNPYSSVVVAPTTATHIAVGVSPVAVAASVYFWAQTWGFCTVNADTAPVVGQKMVWPGASAGAVLAATTVTALALSAPIGWATTEAGGADKAGTYIYLTIAP